MIHDLSELLAEQDTRLSLFSAYPFPNRADRQLDGFQQEAWNFLQRNPDQYFSRQETLNGHEVYRVAVADRMVAEACVNCHNSHPDTPKSDWKIGDIRGVLEVVTLIDGQIASGSSLSGKIIAGVVLVGLMLAAVTVFFARRVSRPIQALTATMKRLSDGDLDVEVQGLQRHDEVGQMASAVEIFKENAVRVAQLQSEQQESEARLAREKREAMQQLADRFEESVEHFVNDLSATAAKLQSASGTMTNIALQTKEKSTIVSSSADEASANVQAVASAAQELTNSIEEISRQVTTSSEIASSGVEKAKITNAKVESLAESAHRVGEVVSLISDIAEQTNLLALNATIEAARAGEAGKGFAVVASEVKNLATQTAKATDDIAGQITSIQTATAEAVSAIKDITGTISTISEHFSSVAAAVEEQTAAAEEIARNVQQASKGTKHVSANIADVTAAAGQVESTAEEVQTSATNLTEQTAQLKQATSGFTSEIRAG
jgi:methyl-accepting chemotaxis protein